MALSRIKTWGAEVLLFTDLNAEFDNLLNNALTLISPWTTNMAAGGYRLTGLGLGAAASPSLQFTGDTDTGIFSSGANTLDLATAGTSWLTLSSVGILTANGTTGAIRLHNLTTAQKNALTPAAGMMVYDTTLSRVETYDTAWRGWGSSFDLIGAGTNTTAAMVLGSGASLTTSGTGTINAAGTGANALQVAGQLFTTFVLVVRNNAGTLEHAIGNYITTGATLSGASSFAAAVSGASSTYASLTTSYTNGVKISSDTAAVLDCDTGTQTFAYMCFIERNTTGTTYLVQPIGQYNLLSIGLYNTAGTAINWNTTTIPSGAYIWVRVIGFVKA